MKRFLFSLLLAVATVCQAATPKVQVTIPLLDANGLLDSTVWLVPMRTAAPAGLLPRLRTDSSGIVTFTNVPAGLYRLHMQNSGIRDLRIIVPDISGTVLAEEIIDPTEGWTAPAGLRGYISSRGVRVLMPPTNGLAGQVLSDIDGLGGLGWKTAASGGGDNVWTNDNDAIYPVPDPLVSSGSPTIVRLLGPGNQILDGGSVISVIGSNNTISNNTQDSFVIGENNIGNRLRGGSSGTSVIIGGNNTFTGTGRFVFGHDNQHLSSGGDADDFVIGANNALSGGFTWCFGDGNTVIRTGGDDVFAFGQNLTATNNSVLLFGRNLTSTNDGQVIFGDASNAIEIQSGGAIKLRGTMTILNVTNQVVFGATNLPPGTPATPSKWISVQVSGESTVYRLPLYQ